MRDGYSTYSYRRATSYGMIKARKAGVAIPDVRSLRAKVTYIEVQPQCVGA